MKKEKRTNRIRTYSFLKTRIANIQEEIDRLTNELNIAKENGLKRKAKEIKKALRIEQKQLNAFCKTKKAYIDTRALLKEQVENELDYDNNNINKITFLTNKKYLDKMIKRKGKKLSFEYKEEIEEQVREDYLKRTEIGETKTNKDIKKKLKIPFLLSITFAAIVLSSIVIHSINNHPEDIYKDILSKKDDFSILVKQIKEKSKNEKAKEENPSISPSKEPNSDPIEPEIEKEIVTPSPKEDDRNLVYREDDLKEEQPYLTYNEDQNEIHVNYIK